MRKNKQYYFNSMNRKGLYLIAFFFCLLVIGIGYIVDKNATITYAIETDYEIKLLSNNILFDNGPYEESMEIPNNSTALNEEKHLKKCTIDDEKAIKILRNKTVSILGDSISTLENYIPEDHMFKYTDSLENVGRTKLYITMDETWWGRLINRYDMKLGINESMSGSLVSNNLDYNDIFLGPDKAMASVSRIKALDDNGTPDVIFFYGGTNDLVRSVTLGTFNDSSSYATTLDLTTTKYGNFVKAYAITLMRLRYYYPTSTIIVLLPYSTKLYSNNSLRKYKTQMKKICDFYGIKYIDLGKSGINSPSLKRYMFDGTHPNSSGMKLISDCIVSRINTEF